MTQLSFAPGCETPERVSKKTKFDAMEEHAQRFDHITARYDAASAYQEPVSPKTPQGGERSSKVASACGVWGYFDIFWQSLDYINHP